MVVNAVYWWCKYPKRFQKCQDITFISNSGVSNFVCLLITGKRLCEMVMFDFIVLLFKDKIPYFCISISNFHYLNLVSLSLFRVINVFFTLVYLLRFCAINAVGSQILWESSEQNIQSLLKQTYCSRDGRIQKIGKVYFTIL